MVGPSIHLGRAVLTACGSRHPPTPPDYQNPRSRPQTSGYQLTRRNHENLHRLILAAIHILDDIASILNDRNHQVHDFRATGATRLGAPPPLTDGSLDSVMSYLASNIYPKPATSANARPWSKPKSCSASCPAAAPPMSKSGWLSASRSRSCWSMTASSRT